MVSYKFIATENWQVTKLKLITEEEYEMFKLRPDDMTASNDGSMS